MLTIFLKVWANPGLFFVYFCPFIIPTSITISITQIEKSIDGVHGIRTQGCRMVVADETRELHMATDFSSVNSTRLIIVKSP